MGIPEDRVSRGFRLQHCPKRVAWSRFLGRAPNVGYPFLSYQGAHQIRSPEPRLRKKTIVTVQIITHMREKARMSVRFSTTIQYV